MAVEHLFVAHVQKMCPFMHDMQIIRMRKELNVVFSV